MQGIQATGMPLGESLLDTQAKILTRSVLDALVNVNAPEPAKKSEEDKGALPSAPANVFDEAHELCVFHFPRERFMSYTRKPPVHGMGDVVYLMDSDVEGGDGPIKVVIIAVIETINGTKYDVALYDPEDPMCTSYGDRMYSEDELYISMTTVKAKRGHLRLVK